MTGALRRTARAYPALLRVGMANAVAYRLEYLVWMLTSTMPLIMLALWRAVGRDGPVGRFGAAEFTAYFLLTLIVRQLTSSWAVWIINMEIRDGTLAMRLLRPIHPLVAYSADNLAAMPMRAALMIPVAVALLASTGGHGVSRQPAHLAIGVAATFGGWLLTFSVHALIATLAFYWESALGFSEIYFGIWNVLSGYLVPLELFPPGVRAVAEVLPFRFMIGFPVEVLMGLHPTGEALRMLALEGLYVGMGLAAMALAWRRGVRRFAAFGG